MAFWAYTVDDTFITLRYARNWANGWGLTWNPGEPPVEGYTSFLWTVVLTPVHWFIEDAQITAKVGSLLATALAWWGMLGWTLQTVSHHAQKVQLLCLGFVTLWMGLQLGSAVHAVTGMDTALFTALLTLLFWAAASVSKSQTRLRCRLFALLALLVGLTRPEGNLAVLVCAGSTLLLLTAAGRKRLLLALALFYLAPAAAYFGWRFAFYGLLFPLPFYVKAVGTSSFWAGANEAASFGRELFLVSPVFLLLFAAGLFKAPRQLVPALAAASALLLFFLKPAPLMAYNHRYLHPLLPAIGVVASVGLGALAEPALSTASVAYRRRLTWAITAATLALLGTGWFSWLSLRSNLEDKLSYAQGLRRAHVALGHHLRKWSQSQQWSGDRPGRVALLDVGAVSYYSDWSVVDTFGLNDREIALRGRAMVDYVLSKRPDAYVFVSRTGSRFDPVFAYEAPLHARIQTSFHRVGSYQFVDGYHLLVFAGNVAPPDAQR